MQWTKFSLNNSTSLHQTYNLDVGSGTQGAQTAAILTGIENVLLKHHPGIVLVAG